MMYVIPVLMTSRFLETGLNSHCPLSNCSSRVNACLCQYCRCYFNELLMCVDVGGNLFKKQQISQTHS